MFSFFFWNCWGAGAKNTQLYIKDILHVHKPCLMALLETRVSSSHAQALLARSYFTNLEYVEVVGYAGGIWVFWDQSRIQVEPISSHDQILTVLVTDVGTPRPWLLSIIYASPQPLLRDQLWQYIAQLGTFVQIPWVLAGDCNQPLVDADKIGGRPINSGRAAKLRAALDVGSLIDLGFQGPRFTWTNGRIGAACIRERID